MKVNKMFYSKETTRIIFQNKHIYTWKVNYVLDSAKFPSNSTSGSMTAVL